MKWATFTEHNNSIGWKMSQLKALKRNFTLPIVTCLPLVGWACFVFENDKTENENGQKQNQTKPNTTKKKSIKLKCGVLCDRITCLVVVPPGSVTGASLIIDWFDFVPTLKLLLPGNACWMVMVPLPLPPLLFVVGVWGVWFTPFPLELLQFNDPDDCTNGKLIVTERSSLIVLNVLCAKCSPKTFNKCLLVVLCLSFPFRCRNMQDNKNTRTHKWCSLCKRLFAGC